MSHHRSSTTCASLLVAALAAAVLVLGPSPGPGLSSASAASESAYLVGRGIADVTGEPGRTA